MKTQHPSAWDRLPVRRLYYPGDDEETLLYKQIWLGIASSSFFLGGIALAVYWWLNLHLLVYLMAGFCGFFLLSLLLFFQSRKYTERFFLVAEIFKILFAFVAVLLTGGILHCGGFVFIGLAGIFFALIFPDPRKVRFLLLLYLGTVVSEALLQPRLIPARVRFSDTQNLTLFVLYFLASILSLYFFVRIYTRERIKFRQQEAEKLRALDTARSRFFTNISHEFRTPLTVILGMAEQLRETAAPQSGNAVRLIRRNGEKVLRLVDQLLDLSKLDSGKLTAHYVQADVVAELRYFLESFESLAKTKRIDLRFSCPSAEIVLDFDPEKLEHIAGNLLENAFKFTPEGGTVALRLERLPAAPVACAAFLPPGPCLLLQVIDTGIGIPTAHLGRIFERYFQVGEWPTEGAGIGLSMVREYVRLLGGHLEVRSRPGEGSTFSIWLPVHREAPPRAMQSARAPEPAEMPLPPTAATTRKPRLLIVEDNPDVIHYLQNFLRDDYEIRTAFDGEKGIALALEYVPDIVISDILMPKKDGLELCRALKADFRTNHIPIVLMTAKTDSDSRIAGLVSGADAYLAKQFHRKELEVELKKLTALRETLKRKYGRSLAGSLPQNPPMGLNERFLYDVQRHLEQNYTDESFGIKALCRLAGVSRTQMHRKLQALTGQSASHFIRSYRLEKARELLRSTRMTVAEAAYAVGFKDPYYFSRTFAQEFGCPPSEARSL